MNKVSYKLIIVLLFGFLLTLLVITNTYALFETNANADSLFTIGRWVILLNGNDVKETRTITLNDFVYTNGAHTENGYFAPGSIASFDLVIDASDSDVSVEYTLDIDDTSIENYSNIEFSVTDLSTNETTTTNSYNGVIRLSDVNKVIRLRLNLEWSDQLEYDESDTSLIDGELEFNIIANFKQYISE